MKKNQLYALLIYFGFTLLGTLFKNNFKYADDVLVILFDLVLISTILISVLHLLRNDLKIAAFETKKSTVQKSLLVIIMGVILDIVVTIVIALLPSVVFYTSNENLSDINTIFKFLPLAIIHTVLITPILEELIFRRILFKVSSKRFNILFGSIFSSLIFSTVHLPVSSSSFLMLFMHAIIYSYIYYRTNRLLIPIILHGIWNLLIIIVFILQN
ncbi:CPBP family intramembrane glutamic endopeptidase [Paenisporosarcina indica]|uniref:CPBP family intramembrane glutamic endopeptidase n=1 Tax=Paenisporosarcina indica TaxID=650093 RepID=UPI00094F516F|nr:type II CAAX endopeptidase family protein [Paenisporosarcina indica]